jgi:hypothetical protein
MPELNTAQDFLNRIADLDSILKLVRINMTAYRSGHNVSDMMVNLAGVRIKLNVETYNSHVKIRWDNIHSIYTIEGGLSLFNVHMLAQEMMGRGLNTMQVLPVSELDTIKKAWRDTENYLEIRL